MRRKREEEIEVTEKEMSRERKWRKGMEGEKEVEGRRENGEGKEKRQGDTVYVIRGDTMAVGAASCLD